MARKQRTMKARRQGVCDGCGQAVSKGDWIVFHTTPVEDPDAGTLTFHQDCNPTSDDDADAAYWATRDASDRKRIMRRVYGDKLGGRWALNRNPEEAS